MYLEALNKIPWGKPKMVYTKEGTKNVQEAEVPAAFWPIWKIHSEKMKASGINIFKTKGKWIIKKWTEHTKEDHHNDIVFDNKILLEWQIEHAKILISDLLNEGAVLDASDTGAGKTYVALSVAKHLNLFPVVIGPKSGIPKWYKVAKLLKLSIFVSNYESYREEKTDNITKTVEIKEKKNKNTGEIKKIKKCSFEWNVPDNAIFIFDEVHRCKNPDTQNAAMLVAAAKTSNKILCLSATIADNPLQMYAIGLVLKLFEDQSGFWRWGYKRGVYKGWFGSLFKNTPENLQKIHDDIFPHKGHRLSSKDNPDFPQNQILAESYAMDNAEQIQAVHDNMKKELAELRQTKKKDTGTSILTELLRARQEIELLKIPTFVELAEDHVEEGMSVALFLNFDQSIEALSERLKTKCIITGKVSPTTKEKNRIAFQEGKERIIICNMKAGGESIDLHDEFGNYPRVSIISPNYSAQELKQVLGRIARTGSKSPALQKIIFCSGTVEEDVAEKVEMKVKNIEHINDGDLL